MHPDLARLVSYETEVTMSAGDRQSFIDMRFVAICGDVQEIVSKKENRGNKKIQQKARDIYYKLKNDFPYDLRSRNIEADPAFGNLEEVLMKEKILKD